MCYYVVEMGDDWPKRCKNLDCSFRIAERASYRERALKAKMKALRPRAIEKLKRIYTALDNENAKYWASGGTHKYGGKQFDANQIAKVTVSALCSTLTLEQKIDEENARKDWL